MAKDSKKILVVGSSNTDMTVITEHLPKPGETVLGGNFTMGPGGKGANQAVIACRLGGNVQFVCKVGRDMFGDNSVKRYEREGLEVSAILRSDFPSGVALIPVDSKAENCIIVASGANGDFTPEDVRSIEGKIAECDILLLQLEIPVESVLEAARIGHKAGAMVVLNPAPAADLPEEIFGYVSLFIPNETELSRFSGLEVKDVESAVEACDILKGKGIGDVIVTMGSKGSLIYTQGHTEFVPAKKVQAVDTTGAGDTFCAGLCVGLSESMSLVEAAEFATIASALAVQRLGAQENAPYRNEVESVGILC